MSLRAKLITEQTIRYITIFLNDGVEPAPETLNMNTFFVYDDVVDRPNEILDRVEFNRRFRWIESGRNDNLIEEL